MPLELDAAMLELTDQHQRFAEVPCGVEHETGQIGGDPEENASVLGQVALSLLELFVACLQAYIFTFLTALFMGMAMHPAH